MIVDRRTYVEKAGGCQEAIVELIKEGHRMRDHSPRFRILTPNVGPWSTVVHELEFEDLAEQRKFWAEWWASEKTPAFMERFYAVVGVGGGNEILNLVE